jgi:cell volume regulation protein A
MDPYLFLILASSAIILSHLFNWLAKRTNLPSVLLLITVGLVAHQVLDRYGGVRNSPLVSQVLNILGISGLIMIVLEAALDLKLSADRRTMIKRSFLLALLALVGTATAITCTVHFVLGADWYRSLVYAMPLSIVSSAIVLPSVASFPRDRKDFIIYEATFSDILGILFFYFLIDDHAGSSVVGIAGRFVWNVVLTVVVSLVASFGLLWIFQRIRTRVKFFLLIAVLILLYALGKKMELSSLLIILVFGLMVSNQGLMFKGWVARITRSSTMLNIEHELHLVTAETAFVVRTFFFLMFGLIIDVRRLLDQDVLVLGGLVMAGIYLVRAVLVGVMRVEGGRTVALLAPRGLITILLAYNIPDHLRIPDRDGSVLLMVILGTSLVMMVGLLTSGRRADLSAVEPEPVEGSEP